MGKLDQVKSRYLQNLLKKYLLGIFISRSSGDLLYSFQVDPSIRKELISSFIAALSMFGEENTGKIKHILIKGINVEMSICSKHELNLVILFRAESVTEYLDEEAEKGLDLFYEEFRPYIEAHRSNQGIYEKFDRAMWKIIQNFLVKIGALTIPDILTDADFILG